MDREHVKGAVDKFKETAGKITGDKELQSEGKFDKAKGDAPLLGVRERCNPRPDQIAGRIHCDMRASTIAPPRLTD